MSEKTFKIVGDDISDGYHTFDELYDHRCILFITLCLHTPLCARWKKDHFEGWDCLYWQCSEGQVSYHVPIKYRYLYETKIERDESLQYDGHTPADCIKRLEKFCSYA